MKGTFLYKCYFIKNIPNVLQGKKKTPQKPLLKYEFKFILQSNTLSNLPSLHIVAWVTLRKGRLVPLSLQMKCEAVL